MLAVFLREVRCQILSVSLAGRFCHFADSASSISPSLRTRAEAPASSASVAFDAGIISPQFYTTLVLAAVLTCRLPVRGSTMSCARLNSPDADGSKRI